MVMAGSTTRVVMQLLSRLVRNSSRMNCNKSSGLTSPFLLTRDREYKPFTGRFETVLSDADPGDVATH